MSKFAIVAVLVVACLGACTWVKPTPEGAQVSVASADSVSGCKRLGNVNVSVKDDMGRVKRKDEKVAGELETLARNEGAVMGGDTVVSQSKISDGRQTFAVYKCGT